jgi:hypothetical protein
MRRLFPRLLPRRHAAWIAAVLAGACSQDGILTDPLGPSEQPAANLNIVAVAPTAAPPELQTVSFYARKDRRSEGRVRLADQPGQGRGNEYLRLTIPKDALLARPDGSPFAIGDSVLITIRVADPARILFELEPTGLRFDPARMAELRIRYEVTAGDLDHNGRHDEQDDSLENHLGIWRQPEPAAPFVRLESIVTRNNREVRALLPGFSRYAIAY